MSPTYGRSEIPSAGMNSGMICPSRQESTSSPSSSTVPNSSNRTRRGPCTSATSNVSAPSKQLPPHPGPGRKNSVPIRLSYPIPTTTSFTSAPTPSQIAAIALMNDNFVAKNAFAAYLIVSADAGSVTNTCARTLSYKPPTRIAAARSSHPTTTRSGRRKSSTAEPSRKNSGFDTTRTSGRLNTRSTTFVLPTGTVDLFTTIASYGNTPAISAAAAST